MCAALSSVGQERTSEAKDGKDVIYGFLDGVVPITIYHDNQEECSGYISYGDTRVVLEGDCSDTLFTLYEFDEAARVVGIIEGRSDDLSELTWYNYNRTVTYPIYIYDAGQKDLLIKAYNNSEAGAVDQILLQPNKKNIFIPKMGDKSIRWSKYACPRANYACQIKHKGKTTTLSLSDRTISIGSQLYRWKEDLPVRHISGHDHHYLYSFIVPDLEQKDFDEFFTFIIDNKVNSFLKSMDIDPSDPQPDQRLMYRCYGDMVITLMTDEFISGHLLIQDVQSQRTATHPFTFDRNKKRFLKLREIWNDDFNFSYFLKSLIENQKREILSSEKGEIRQLLKDQPFSHFGLTPEAMVFYTDFHFVYGRRSIYVPYDEIHTFIDDKTLSQYIRKTHSDE